MDNLTFSIYYTPNNVLMNEPINFICSDKKIHIRFRDFNHEELIYGFEKKLTYLMTYLMNYSFKPRTIGEYSVDTLINNFLKTSDTAEIISCINLYMNSVEFKGFKVKTNYKRKSTTSDDTFGNVNPECFPMVVIDDVMQIGDLKTFLKKLRINLTEYLFNDNYIIVIHKNKKLDFNSKFIKKQMKKDLRKQLFNSDLQEIELW